MMDDNIRWGIIGTGNMAHQFARGLADVPKVELVAIGSRSSTSANEFGKEFNVPRKHSSYQALASDPNVDVVYISTPNAMHYDNCRLCLQAGKAVLCEKTFTSNAIQAKELIDLARSKNLFLMEAMWSRFVPAYVKLRQLLKDDLIGKPQMLVADFGIQADFDPQSRLFDPQLGGGALLDVGIYPVSLASMVFGVPSKIKSLANFGKTGVNERLAVIFGYDGGQLASLYSAISTETPGEVVMMGSKGRIKLHAPIVRPTKLTLSIAGQPDRMIETPYEGNGYNYEAAEVVRCLQAGRQESEIMSLDETLAIMRTLDQIRAQWHKDYPAD